MMKATGHKRCHTLTLLRRLREWGYVVPVGSGKGPRNFSSLRIPLNQFGNITPEPMSPQQIAELRAKYARKSKRVDQAADIDQANDADAGAEEQAQKHPPASSPASKPAEKPADQARPFPAVATALSTAIMPMPEPIPITPPPVPLTPEEEAERDRQEQIAGWQEQANYYQLKRDQQPANSRGWLRWDRHLQEALQALEEWKQAPVQTVAVLSIVETPKGEYA